MSGERAVEHVPSHVTAPRESVAEFSARLGRTLVMGIVNVTPNSFSDGGLFLEPTAAIEQALKLVSEGADLIDIGGESTRPGALPVESDVEIGRVLPVIEGIRRHSDVTMSIDTYHSMTAEAALRAGATMVNDVSAGRFDPSLLAVVCEYEADFVIMHMQGNPQTMQVAPMYADVIADVNSFFDQRISKCTRAGIRRERIVLDPGIGFGKRLTDNVRILKSVAAFKSHGLPILVGASRKLFIDGVTGHTSKPSCRLGGSIAAALISAGAGVTMLRVHDVRETVEALAVMRAITDGVPRD